MSSVTVFKTPEEGTPLEMVVYSPVKSQDRPVPCVVFFFGGGWQSGSNKQFSLHAEYLSRRGVVGITAQYRTRSSHDASPQICVADGRSAMRWVRSHADELGVDPDSIVAAGGSAGGHVAACTELLDGPDDPADNLSVGCRPSHLLLFNPVIDTTPAGYGADKLGEDKTALSPVHHVRAGIVPTLVIHGTGDEAVPYENAERFTSLMTESGNDCSLIPFDNRCHGFFNSPSLGYNQGSDEDFEAVISHMDKWLVEQGILDGDAGAAKEFLATVTEQKD